MTSTQSLRASARVLSSASSQGAARAGMRNMTAAAARLLEASGRSLIASGFDLEAALLLRRASALYGRLGVSDRARALAALADLSEEGLGGDSLPAPRPGALAGRLDDLTALARAFPGLSLEALAALSALPVSRVSEILEEAGLLIPAEVSPETDLAPSF